MRRWDVGRGVISAAMICALAASALAQPANEDPIGAVLAEHGRRHPGRPDPVLEARIASERQAARDELARLDALGLGDSRAAYDVLLVLTSRPRVVDKPETTRWRQRLRATLEVLVARDPTDDALREALIKELREIERAAWVGTSKFQLDLDALDQQLIALESTYRDARKIRRVIERAERIELDQAAEAARLRQTAVAHLEAIGTPPLTLTPLRESLAAYAAATGDVATARVLRQLNLAAFAPCARLGGSMFITEAPTEACSDADFAMMDSLNGILLDPVATAQWPVRLQNDLVLSLALFTRRAGPVEPPTELTDANGYLERLLAVVTAAEGERQPSAEATVRLQVIGAVELAHHGRHVDAVQRFERARATMGRRRTMVASFAIDHAATLLQLGQFEEVLALLRRDLPRQLRAGARIASDLPNAEEARALVTLAHMHLGETAAWTRALTGWLAVARPDESFTLDHALPLFFEQLEHDERLAPAIEPALAALAKHAQTSVAPPTEFIAEVLRILAFRQLEFDRLTHADATLRDLEHLYLGERTVTDGRYWGFIARAEWLRAREMPRATNAYVLAAAAFIRAHGTADQAEQFRRWTSTGRWRP